MRFTNSALAAFFLVAATPVVTSFVPASKPNDFRASEALFLSPEDLTNYMAKAHEEKLRAVKDVETKKNTEIQFLKDEVTDLKKGVPRESSVVVSSSVPSAGADLSKLTIDELRAKLVQYQEFMANYIVKAQQDKMRAVQAAQLATAAKYEAKIKFLIAAAEGSASVAAPTSSADTKLYDTRSANVAAAAKAGKSRWGDKEVAKVKITPPDVDVKSETDNLNGAAKANGVAAAAPAPISLPGTDLFDSRNQKVAAAGKAGKSRWGDAEVEKATTESSKPSLSSAPSTPPPAAPVVVSAEVEAADHGLRNDGGVGGPSLAERVNLGQQLFTPSDASSSAPPAEIEVVSAIRSSYDLRNARVAAAAAVGKSRWGSMENSKATSLAASNALSGSDKATLAAKTPVIVTTPEIEAADHGLRNDGGVGGPSLAERINVGSGSLKD